MCESAYSFTPLSRQVHHAEVLVRLHQPCAEASQHPIAHFGALLPWLHYSGSECKAPRCLRRLDVSMVTSGPFTSLTHELLKKTYGILMT